jgi:Asp/Glu/hydantoin racemase
MRIWYQSFVSEEESPVYFTELRTRLAAVAGPGNEVVVGGLDPPDAVMSRVSELRCSVQAVDAIAAAEQAGYDAAVLGHFQDSGLYEARCAVDIPVIGMGEATMLYACQLGDRFGLVTIHPSFVQYHREQLQRYRLTERCAGVVSFLTGLPEFMEAFANAAARTRIVERFRTSAETLIDAGAEVVISAGGLFGTLTLDEPGFEISGAAVLNPVAVALLTAQSAVRLRRLNGTGVSRAHTYPKAPVQAIDELRELARRH